MSISMRVFLVQEDDSLRPLSVARYERLQRGDPQERLSRYAGMSVRCAVALVETENGQPVQILRIEFPLLYIDGNGCIDVDQLKRERRLAVETFPSTFKSKMPEGVVDARHLFARKQYERAYRWTPTPEIEAAIIHAVFERKEFRR